MSKKLLVLTDFSKNADSALRYAAQIALHCNFELSIVHIFKIQLTRKVGRFIADKPRVDEQKKSEEKLRDLDSTLRTDFPALKFSTHPIKGELVAKALQLLRENDFQLLIMGSKGEGNLKSSFMGSNTLALLKKSPIGVLAVPAKTSEFKLEKVGLLCNFKKTEKKLLKSFSRRIPGQFDLTLLHVTEKYNSPPEEIVAAWKKYLNREELVRKVEYLEKNAVYRLDYHMPLRKCIDWMIKESAIDLLMVSYNRKSFFRQLFMRNLSKNIAANLIIPTYFQRNMRTAPSN